MSEPKFSGGGVIRISDDAKERTEGEIRTSFNKLISDDDPRKEWVIQHALACNDIIAARNKSLDSEIIKAASQKV